MADIRCPRCGENNPDFLDVCQFCQTPLKSESMLHIGETPTKKNTGELESVLPEWLKDMRQQARSSAQEEADHVAAQPKVQKNEPPDLLAGLASQTEKTNDEDVPDWLASINPAAKPKPSAPSSPEPETDFFAQFNKTESKSAPISEPSQEQNQSWMDKDTGQSPVPAEKDELSDWFSQAADQPAEPVNFEPTAGQENIDWISSPGSSATPAQEPAPKEAEDLSWLYDLEAASKQTGDLATPKQDMGWMGNLDQPSSANASQPSASQEDLSWLDNLGGIAEPPQGPPAQPFDPSTPSAGQDFPRDKPSAPQEDLGWLNQFAGTSEPSQPAQPSASQEDLSWLNDLGGIAEPSQSSSPQENLDQFNDLGATSASLGSETSQVPTSEEDMSWLNKLDDVSASAPSAASQEELSWLNDLGGAVEPLAAEPFTESTSASQDQPDWMKNMQGEAETPLFPVENLSPRRTAPLSAQAQQESEPEWLKSATEAPSMPAPGDLSMDWFKQSSPTEKEPRPHSLLDALVPDSSVGQETPQSGSDESNIFSSSAEPSTLSSQDVDSLFSVEMPDWLSRRESDIEETTSQPAETSSSIESDESLAPVELPSWVQAMRPMESVISESAPSIDAQPTEKLGPLAGLSGVIPVAPLTSMRKPKAFSLKLQASDEQQASAALLEEILGGETNPRALLTPSLMLSQHMLRWALSGLFLLVLGIIIGGRSQLMQVSAELPVGVSNLSNVVMNIPDSSKVLVVIDYEPSLAGEMEAVSSPLLNQTVLLRHAVLSFVSTSPNGAALVERLMASSRINTTAPDGLGYEVDKQYFNLGYLPGGSAGVLGFIEAPDRTIPSADVQAFSEYSALVVLTDHAESGRVWVEQLQNRKQIDPALANQPLLVVASAQAGPLLQPYVSSSQITGILSGLSDAARYEYKNNITPGIARSYWDAFGIGLMMTIALIAIGSLWSLFVGIRERRAEAG